MWFENKVTSNKEAFLQKVRLICAKLGIEPDWLMFVMNSESGLNPAAYNPNGGASGLIQFMPDTAKGLGTRPKPYGRCRMSPNSTTCISIFIRIGER